MIAANVFELGGVVRQGNFAKPRVALNKYLRTITCYY